MAVEAEPKTHQESPEDRRVAAYKALDDHLQKTPIGSTAGVAFWDQFDLAVKEIDRDTLSKKLRAEVTRGKVSDVTRIQAQEAQIVYAGVMGRIRDRKKNVEAYPGYTEAAQTFGQLVGAVRKAENGLGKGIVIRAQRYKTIEPGLRRGMPPAKAA
jgi:hypothetical protein